MPPESLFLFDRLNPAPDPSPAIPVRVPPPAQARLSAQCARILERLRLGPATNGELARACLNSRARVSDLRAAGYDIECYDRDHVTGLSWYRLRGEHER